MKTRVFKRFASLPKNFLENFESIWLLNSDEREKLIDGISRLGKCEYAAEADGIRDDLVVSTGGDPKTVLKAINALEFLYNHWNPVTDTAEGFWEDLKSLSLIPTDKDEETKRFVLGFFSSVAKDNIEKLKRIATTDAIPTFSHVSGVVDFRPIFDKPFGSYYTNKIEDHKPSCIGWAPVLVIYFGREDDNFNDFTFQCSELQLQKIIDYLNSMKIDLEIAKSSFPDRELLDHVE